MHRWGSLALRLSLIGVASLVLVVAIGAVLFYVQRMTDVGEGTSPPVPDQMAAVVELVETTPKAALPLVLRSLNSPTLRLRVVDSEPAMTSGAVDLPALHWIVARYLDALGGRTARVQLQPHDASLPTGPLALTGRPLRIDVRLRDGRWISAEVRGELLSRAIGMPLAFAALVLTVIVAGVTLWAIRREVRPLESLSAATERFGSQLDSTRMEERGSREVRGLIGAFNRMQDRIRALVEGRTRLLAAISHDVGTYLTRLRLRAEFIGDADQRGRTVRDIGEMQALLADSLALARLERDDAPLGEADLASVVRAQAEAFAADGATISVGPINEPFVVTGSDVALGRLVANLISNAVKYGGGAEVSLKRSGDSAELVVEDRGPGIPAEQREQVLEPFFRRDEARNLNAPGSGLGLAIANDITRRVGGTLALSDREGGGLTVTVRLPLAQLN